MGRTLHWNIKTPTPVTDEQNDKLVAFSEAVNKNIKWTCENFWIDTVQWYPNWKYWEGKEENAGAWKKIEAKLKEYKQTMPYTTAVRKLTEEGLVNIHDSMVDADGLHGFCKVRDNEWNSYCILMSLANIKDILPDSEIRLYDEGEFLYMPVLMKGGKYYVDWDDFNDNMEYHKTKCADRPEYLEKDLKEKAYIESKMKPDGSLDINDLHRPVNPADFVDHESGGVMAGNYGEYWNPENKKQAEDAEAQLMNMFTKAFEGTEISVCGEKPIILDSKPLPNENA